MWGAIPTTYPPLRPTRSVRILIGMNVYRCAQCGALNRAKQSDDGRRPICGKCKKALDLSGAPQNVSGTELAKAVKSSPVPILVDFWAPWCGPCRMVAPTLEAIGRERSGDLLVLKVNSDEHPQASSQHGVRGIPTMVLFRGGREVSRQTGALPRPALEGWLASAA